MLAEMGLRRLFNHLLLQTGGEVEEAMRWMRALQDRGYLDPDVDLDAFFARLTEENVIGQDANGNLVLAAGGERQIRRDALDEIFGGLQKSITGTHSVATPGQGTERLTETRAYQFGDDPMSIDSIRSLQNAMKQPDPGDAILMTEDDLEVFETEHNSSCATVVMIDISHSMVLYGEDRITPAKKVALALTELILTKYPKDSIDVLLFGDEATEVPISEIPYAKVGPYHTNTKAGLELAQRILRRRKHNNKQIFMITDGKPAPLTDRGLNGAGQIVAVLDTGVDYDNCYFAEADGSRPPINTGTPVGGYGWTNIDLSRRKIVAYDFLYSCAQFPGASGCDDPNNP